MRPRKLSAFEVDCQTVRSFLVARVFKTETAVLDAFARIERRGARTRVAGKDHVLHIQESEGYMRVYCGRRSDLVNTVMRSEATDLSSEQWCKRCVARIEKEAGIP